MNALRAFGNYIGVRLRRKRAERLAAAKSQPWNPVTIFDETHLYRSGDLDAICEAAGLKFDPSQRHYLHHWVTAAPTRIDDESHIERGTE